MIRDPYGPGALQYMPLRFDRTRPCRFCGAEFRTVTGNGETCPECIGSAAHVAWKRRRQAVYTRRRKGQ